jgi:hypothetical protein
MEYGELKILFVGSESWVLPVSGSMAGESPVRWRRVRQSPARGICLK